MVGEAFAKLVPQVDEAKTLVIKDMTKVSVKEAKNVEKRTTRALEIDKKIGKSSWQK